MKFTCPCCGSKSLDLEPPGTFSICEVCDWEDDKVQFNDPDFEGGANIYSLRQSQQKYANGYRAKHHMPIFELDPSWVLLPANPEKTQSTDYNVDSNGTKGSDPLNCHCLLNLVSFYSKPSLKIKS